MILCGADTGEGGLSPQHPSRFLGSLRWLWLLQLSLQRWWPQPVVTLFTRARGCSPAGCRRWPCRGPGRSLCRRITSLTCAGTQSPSLTCSPSEVEQLLPLLSCANKRLPGEDEPCCRRQRLLGLAVGAVAHKSPFRNLLGFGNGDCHLPAPRGKAGGIGAIALGSFSARVCPPAPALAA